MSLCSLLRGAVFVCALTAFCVPAWAASPAGDASNQARQPAQQPPATAPPPPGPVEVRAPEVVIPASMMLPAPEGMGRYFPNGFAPGLGFGLNCAQGQPDGSMVLHTLTGRGPTAPGPTVTRDGKALASTIFVLPGFHPSIVTMKLSGDKATVIGILPLRKEDGGQMTGLPPAPAVEGSPVSAPLDAALKRLSYDKNGLDPQGVAYDYKRGRFWIADGYRPAMVGVSPRDGAVLSVFDASDGLQEYLATRRPGWGFAGVSMSPSGKVFTMMRGVLFSGGKPGLFSRIVEFDPDTERVRQLCYPIDLETFEDPARVVTGDPVAFADKRLLVLEQGVDKEGRARSLVFAVDLTTAHNINKVTNDAGQTPESLADPALLKRSFNLARKTLVMDLHAAGFKEAWAESMTLLADGRTLAFMGGHGFGLQQQIAGYATGADGKPVLDPAAYVLGEDGKLSADGKPTQASFIFRPSAVAPRLWVATLPKKVSEY
ncbi:MAG: esterase-like activity of phytase family protein [Thermodesulfobacteriota bacterium]